ncbi:hypothetical protein BH10ACT9_BH10ACT9_41860 [soil metagenome]
MVVRTPARPTAAPSAPAIPASAAPATGAQREVTLISLGGAATDPLLRRVSTELDGAVDAVESFWGTDWPHEILVVATGTDAEFVGQAAGVADTAHIAAVTVADDWGGSGQRIVFAPGAVSMTPAALRIVLTHELFHYAARSETAADAPRWLTEGVADYVARPFDPGPAGRRGPLPQALPSDADFAAAEPELSLAYDRAWWFARFVADRYGIPALRELYVRAAGPGHTDVPTAVQQVLGADEAQVLMGWRDWLTRNGLA